MDHAGILCLVPCTLIGLTIEQTASTVCTLDAYAASWDFGNWAVQVHSVVSPGVVMDNCTVRGPGTGEVYGGNCRFASNVLIITGTTNNSYCTMNNCDLTSAGTSIYGGAVLAMDLTAWGITTPPMGIPIVTMNDCDTYGNGGLAAIGNWASTLSYIGGTIHDNVNRGFFGNFDPATSTLTNVTTTNDQILIKGGIANITNCDVHGGIGQEESAVYVTDCDFVRDGNSGIVGEQEGIIVVDGCTFFETGGWAAEAEAGDPDDMILTVRNCTFTSCALGSAGEGTSITIENCHYENVATRVIKGDDMARARCTSVTVLNCTNEAFSVKGSGMGPYVFEDITVSGCLYDVIKFEEKGVTVRDSIFTNTGRRAIFVKHTNDQATSITNCWCENNGQLGFAAVCLEEFTLGAIDGLTILNCSETGLEFPALKRNTWNISNLVVAGCAEDGLYSMYDSQGGPGLVIDGADIVNNGRYGVWLRGRGGTDAKTVSMLYGSDMVIAGSAVRNLHLTEGELFLDHSIVALDTATTGMIYTEDNGGSKGAATIRMVFDFCDLFDPLDDLWEIDASTEISDIHTTFTNSIIVSVDGMVNPNTNNVDGGAVNCAFWCSGTPISGFTSTNNYTTSEPLYLLPYSLTRAGFRYWNQDFDIGTGGAEIGSQGSVGVQQLRARNWSLYN